MPFRSESDQSLLESQTLSGRSFWWPPTSFQYILPISNRESRDRGHFSYRPRQRRSPIHGSRSTFRHPGHAVSTTSKHSQRTYWTEPAIISKPWRYIVRVNGGKIYQGKLLVAIDHGDPLFGHKWSPYKPFLACRRVRISKKKKGI